MSSNKKLVLLRLQKQQKRMQDEPIEQAWIARQGILNFHFCIYGLSGEYQGGYYHGVLQLSEDYPFSPPKLMFFTPSGRFEIIKPICTSFTNFHKQTWTSSWTVRTMVIATISFMTSDEQGAGGMNSSYLTKRQYARNSMIHNLNNPLFKQLFRKQIKDTQNQRGEVLSKQKVLNEKEEKRLGLGLSGNTKLYGLYLLLSLLIFLWFYLKG